MLRALFHFVLAGLLIGAIVSVIPAPTGSPAAPSLAIAKSADKLPIYDELADATRDVRAAIMQALSERKQVALVFGANWCPDCRAFDDEANAPDLGSALALNYVVVKIDVGRFKKNLDLSNRYGLNVRRGIPAVVIVGADDKTVLVADGRKMAELRGDGPKGLIKFFEANVSAQKNASSRP